MDFVFGDENTDQEHRFALPGLTEEKLEEVLDDSWDELVEKTEREFGVHDGESTDDSFGFFSYEIPEEDFPIVMERYRQWFAARGYTPGPVTVATVS
jgi:hypothetical protein